MKSESKKKTPTGKPINLKPVCDAVRSAFTNQEWKAFQLGDTGNIAYAVRYPDCLAIQKDEAIKASNYSDYFCSYNNDEGEHYFIRADIRMQIAGKGIIIIFGIWVELCRANYKHFQTYIAPPVGFLVYEGMLSNEIPGYPSTYGREVLINTSEFSKPWIDFINSDCPLKEEISLKEISAEKADFLNNLMDSIIGGGNISETEGTVH